MTHARYNNYNIYEHVEINVNIHYSRKIKMKGFVNPILM